MNFNLEEIMILLGEKDLIIYEQTKMIKDLQNKLNNLNFEKLAANEAEVQYIPQLINQK